MGELAKHAATPAREEKSSRVGGSLVKLRAEAEAEAHAELRAAMNADDPKRLRRALKAMQEFDEDEGDE